MLFSLINKILRTYGRLSQGRARRSRVTRLYYEAKHKQDITLVTCKSKINSKLKLQLLGLFKEQHKRYY
jgi:hypothetical protein